MTRWKVKVNDATGGEMLESALAAAGFELEGDMLFGDQFEQFDHPSMVHEVAHNLGQIIWEIARLNPELDVGFAVGPIIECDDGGATHIHNITQIIGAGSVALAGQPVSVIVGSLTEKERQELDRQAKAKRASQLVHAVMMNGDVLTVLKLLDGEPTTTDLNHALEIIQDEADIKSFTSRKQLRRFTASINHPAVLGLKARHARLGATPPKNPMSMEAATQFIRDLADRWIKSL